jgi:hypothetical protein
MYSYQLLIQAQHNFVRRTIVVILTSDAGSDLHNAQVSDNTGLLNKLFDQKTFIFCQVL